MPPDGADPAVGARRSIPGRLRPPVMLILDPGTEEALCREAVLRYPEESCGILFGEVDDGRVWVRRVEHRENAADPAARGHAFYIPLHDLRRLSGDPDDRGSRIVGYVHSHPDGAAVPSRFDMDFLRLWPRTAWIILAVERGEVSAIRAWWLDSPHVSQARELAVRGAPGAGFDSIAER